MGEGLLADPHRVGPEKALAVEGADQLVDTADLAPEHADHQGDHHRQRQEPRPQAQGVKVSQLRQGGGMDQLGQVLRHLLVGRSHGRALAPVALDGAGVADGTAFLRFGLGGGRRFHTPVLSLPSLPATPLTKLRIS